MKTGIYLIRNKITGSLYVGSAVDIERRWRKHRTELNTGIHGNQKLLRAWMKYGAEAFEFSVIQLTDRSRDALLAAEQHWIDTLDVCGDGGYNILAKAGSHMGAKRSAETVAKLREINRGRSPDEAAREKMRAAKVGKALSPEHRAKLAAAHAEKHGDSVGVRLKEGRWVAQARRAGKQYWLGSFATQQEAIAARRQFVEAA